MRNIARNFLYNFAYQILMIVIPIVTTPYLAHVLGADAIGINSYISSVVMLFSTFGLLGLSNYSNREIAYSSAKGKEALSKTFVSLCVIRIVLFAVCLPVYLAVQLFSAYGYYFALQFFVLFYNFIDISWLFVGIEDMKTVVIKNTFVKVVSTAMIFVLVKKESDLGIYMLINGCSACLGALMVSGQAKKYVRLVRIGREDIVKHIIPVIRLFLPQAASSMYVLFDKTMIQWLTDDVRSVGFYDQSQIISKVPIVLMGSLTTVMLPRISNAYCKKELEKVKGYLADAIGFAVTFAYPFLFGLAGIAPTLVPWYLGEQFLECISLLQFFSVTIIPIYLTNVTGIMYLMALDRTKEMTVSYLSAAIINLLLNGALIPRFGAYGAVAGTICAEFTVLFIQYHYMKKEMGSMHLVYRSIKSILASVPMFFVVWGIGKHMGAEIKVTVAQIFTGAVIYFIITYFLKKACEWRKNVR